jgi:hypothetical protein
MALEDDGSEDKPLNALGRVLDKLPNIFWNILGV